MSDPDTVVVGSGVGGLTAALALARRGDRVLVLEQHYLPGGWTHSFQLGGHSFSPGLHYVGELGTGGRLRRIYEGLGLGADLAFAELNPDGFDVIHVGGQRFDLCKGRERLAERFARRFPAEARGGARYLEVLARMFEEVDVLTSASSAGDWARAPFRVPTLLRWGAASLDGLLRHHVRDPVARAVLGAQVGDHALPPRSVPAAYHAVVAAHYFDGAWFPVGGARSLPRAYVRGLRAAGGAIRLRSRVDSVLTERIGAGAPRRALGVRLADGTEIRARRVVVNADPGVTFGTPAGGPPGLVAAEAQSRRLRARMARTRWSLGCVSLFAAVALDLPSLGFDSANRWLLGTPDLDAAFLAATEGDGPLPFVFLSVPTLKDPTRRAAGRTGLHTLEAFAPCRWEVVARWEEERPEAYAAWKARIVERFLLTLAPMIPGLRAGLRFVDLGSPLTNRTYCASTRGSIYGTAKVLRQIGPFGFATRTEIAGLWSCGASTLGHGVMGATLSGLRAAADITGLSVEGLLGDGPALRCVPADGPPSHPADTARTTPSAAEAPESTPSSR